VASSGLAPTGPCPYDGGLRAECSAPGEVSPEWSRGAESPPLTLTAMLLGMQPRVWFAFWAASTHCWVTLSFSSTSTSKYSPQGYSQPILCPACTHVWDCLDPDAGPCTWPC